MCIITEAGNRANASCRGGLGTGASPMAGRTNAAVAGGAACVAEHGNALARVAGDAAGGARVAAGGALTFNGGTIATVAGLGARVVGGPAGGQAFHGGVGPATSLVADRGAQAGVDGGAAGMAGDGGGCGATCSGASGVATLHGGTTVAVGASCSGCAWLELEDMLAAAASSAAEASSAKLAAHLAASGKLAAPEAVASMAPA